MHSLVFGSGSLPCGWAQVHAGQSGWHFSGSIGRAKDVVTVKGIKSPSCFSCPIRMNPELEDDVNRCPLKEERVKWSATKEGLHLETLQVTKPVGWILAQKLRQQIPRERWDKSQRPRHVSSRKGNNICKPHWAVTSEQSWGSWGWHKENLWPCSAWYYDQTLRVLETETGKKDKAQWTIKKRRPHLEPVNTGFMDHHLPCHQWEQQNAKGPPVSSMVVWTSTEDLWSYSKTTRPVKESRTKQYILITKQHKCCEINPHSDTQKAKCITAAPHL